MFLVRLFAGLGTLGAVLRTTLATTVHTGRVERTAHQVVTYTGEVLHTTAADEHDGVFLQVVAFSGDIGVDLLAIGQSYTRHLTHRRVRLLRGRGVHTRTNAPALRTRGQCGGLALVLQTYSAVSH